MYEVDWIAWKIYGQNINESDIDGIRNMTMV